MEAASVRFSEWTIAQKGVLAVSVVLTIWNVAGLLANPDFATGADATAVQVLGVDFNGWHALSGFLLVGPGFLMCLRPGWALFFSLYAGAVLVLTAIWALVDTEPADRLAFPHNEADAVLHFGFAAAYFSVAALQLRADSGTA
jgi:hypothetical protein